MVQIRNRLGALASAAALSLAGAAHAATFDLSYSFNDTGDHQIDTIVGTVDGDLNGSLLTNLHDFNLSYDGNPFTGTVSALAIDPATGNTSAAAPQLSTTASQNSVLISSDDGSFSFGFIVNFDGAGNQLVFANDMNLTTHGAASDLGANASWSLVAAPVPEPAGLAMLLAGLGLVGVVARRRAA